MQPPHGIYLLGNTAIGPYPVVESMTPEWWGNAVLYRGVTEITPSLQAQRFPTEKSFVLGDLVVNPVTPELIAHLFGIWPGPYSWAVGTDDTVVLGTQHRFMGYDVEIQGPTTDCALTRGTQGYTFTINN